MFGLFTTKGTGQSGLNMRSKQEVNDQYEILVTKCLTAGALALIVAIAGSCQATKYQIRKAIEAGPSLRNAF